MKFARDLHGVQYLITKYTDDSVVVNETVYTTSLLIAATSLSPWRPQTLSEVTQMDFMPVIELKPSVFILGVGNTHQFPAPDVLKPLYEARIGVEIMTTAAACRTFNVLVNEGRPVVAGLLRG